MCIEIEMSDGDEWVGTIGTGRSLCAAGLRPVDYDGQPVDCADEDGCLCGIDVAATLDAAGVAYQRDIVFDFEVQVADLPRPDAAAQAAQRESDAHAAWAMRMALAKVKEGEG